MCPIISRLEKWAKHHENMVESSNRQRPLTPGQAAWANEHSEQAALIRETIEKLKGPLARFSLPDAPMMAIDIDAPIKEEECITWPKEPFHP